MFFLLLLPSSAYFHVDPVRCSFFQDVLFALRRCSYRLWVVVVVGFFGGWGMEEATFGCPRGVYVASVVVGRVS